MSGGNSTRKRRPSLPRKKAQPPRAKGSPRPKTSMYKGVSRYQRTSRWEATISLDAKQKSLGACSTEEAAARTYDRASIKFRKISKRTLNFPYSDYEQEIPQWADIDDLVFVEMLRQMSRRDSLMWFTPEPMQNSKAYRLSTTYHGVYLDLKENKWFASIRHVGTENRTKRLGFTDTEEESARAYERAAGADAPLKLAIDVCGEHFRDPNTDIDLELRLGPSRSSISGPSGSRRRKRRASQPPRPLGRSRAKSPRLSDTHSRDSEQSILCSLP